MTNLIDKLNEWCGRILSWIMVLLILLIVFEIITRRFFGKPSIWTFDVITQLYGAQFILLAGYTLLYDGHVGIDIFYSRLSIRKRAVVDIITYLVFFFPWIIVMTWQGARLSITSWERMECAYGLFSIPLYPIKTVLLIGIVLLFLQGVSKLLSTINVLRTQKDTGGD